MADFGTKRCVVVYATRDHQYLWTVDLPDIATIADALNIARGLAASTLTTRGTHEEIEALLPPGDPDRLRKNLRALS